MSAETVGELVWSFVARAGAAGLDEDPEVTIARTVRSLDEGRYPAGIAAVAEELQVPWPCPPGLLAASAAAGRAQWATRQRNEAIRALVDQGVSLRVVGEACGLSHTAVRQVAGRRPAC